MKTKTICPTKTATILACKNIAKSFSENIYELSRIRKEWDPEYANSLKNWIDDIIDKNYSPGDFKEEKYSDWHEIMISALKCLSIIRASVKVDFKQDKEFVKDFLKKHGYDDFFSEAKNGDHLSLYNLIKTFANNLNQETRNKIVSKGINESIISRILDFSDEINQYSDCFEMMDDDSSLNKNKQKEVEEIYSTIKDICRISTAYYQYEPVKRDEFAFYKVLRSL